MLPSLQWPLDTSCMILVLYLHSQSLTSNIGYIQQCLVTLELEVTGILSLWQCFNKQLPGGVWVPEAPVMMPIGLHFSFPFFS